MYTLLSTHCLHIVYTLYNNADTLANVLTGVTVEPLDGCVCLLKFIHVPRSLSTSSTGQGYEKWINISIEMKNDTWQQNKINNTKGAALEWEEVCTYHIQLKYLHENNPILPNEMEKPELYSTQEQKKEMEQVLHHTFNSSSTKGGVSAGSAGSGGGTTSGTTTGIRRCVLSINPNLLSPHLATTKALSMNALNRDMQRMHLQHKHKYPAPTVLVKVEGNETLAAPQKYHHQSKHFNRKSMSRRNTTSFMGSTLSSTLQVAMEGISDPCRVSVWPPETSSHALTAAVTKRHTIDKVLKMEHNKSTTEWIQLYEPPVMLDSDDEGNTSSESDDDDDDDDKKHKKEQQRQQFKDDHAQNTARHGHVPGKVFFNPFTCQYRVELQARRADHDVPDRVWHGTCRARVSITKKNEHVPKLNHPHPEQSGDATMEHCAHVSNAVDGLFSKCAACGGCVKVRCRFVEDKISKMSDAEEGEGRVKHGTYARRTCTSTESWAPVHEEDHCTRHVRPPTMHDHAYAKHDMQNRMAYVQQQHLTVAVSERHRKQASTSTNVSEPKWRGPVWQWLCLTIVVVVVDNGCC